MNEILRSNRPANTDEVLLARHASRTAWDGVTWRNLESSKAATGYLHRVEVAPDITPLITFPGGQDPSQAF